MESKFGSMNMASNIQQWFVTLAKSSNPYQKKEDNREVEIKTVIRLLHEIDNRIDPEFLEIGGDDRVSLKVEGAKRELSQLSSGFSSILKLVQAIVSGYGYFTNETQLQNVKGIVLIDEIESHLHLTWQVNIIPLLKNCFPIQLFTSQRILLWCFLNCVRERLIHFIVIRMAQLKHIKFPHQIRLHLQIY